MPITINGSGTVTGISAGGLPDAIITAPELSGAQTGSAPIYGCRAWVYFDSTRNESDTGASVNGANVKIRGSGNVTSVLKNAAGDYTVTFTTAMPDTNYVTLCTVQDAKTSTPFLKINSAVYTTTTVGLFCGGNGGTSDPTICSVAIFR